MFSVKVYCEYSSPSGNDYDEEIVPSWEAALKIAKKFRDGVDEAKGVYADIGIEITDDDGKKFIDVDFNDFDSKVFEYGKVRYGYNRHELIKEDNYHE